MWTLTACAVFAGFLLGGVLAYMLERGRLVARQREVCQTCRELRNRGCASCREARAQECRTCKEAIRLLIEADPEPNYDGEPR